MRPCQLLLATAGLLLGLFTTGSYGGCAYDCIDNLNITNCSGIDFFNGYDCVCTDEVALESVNSCVTSSCSSSEQDTILGNIAQACANGGSPTTAEATVSATSGGTLFAFSDGAYGFGEGQGAGFSVSTALSPSIVPAATTGETTPSLGATVVTTVSGQALTGTIFTTTQGQAVSTAVGIATIVAQNEGLARNDQFGAFAAMVVAVLAATSMV